MEALKEKLKKEYTVLSESVMHFDGRQPIIGDSEPIQHVLKQVERVAPTNATVLLYGETGTGKELIAHEIHAQSLRRDRSMVTVNCAALPASLIEAELFGREKGAFTGAENKVIGRFEIADGSTIFLDEIGELSVDLQVKLLRVLQEGEFERLGSTKTIKVDVRIISATNRKLEEAVRNGDFREDLYYRLNVFPITLPPLRDRIEDIEHMVATFSAELSREMGKHIELIPKEAIRNLENYHWPGNVRELRNVIERAIIMTSDSTLRMEPSDERPAQSDMPTSFAEASRQCILSALEKTKWRISGSGGAAQVLGLNPTTLRSKMEKLQITKPH
ncbi:MAG: sigma-54 interaction domain-containing protein [bacterium]